MKYYISDLHLFHPAILQKCSRPFATIDDMHRTIFQNWKKKGIGPCDEVYILAEVRDTERKVVLFHYPIEEWNGFYVGSYHLHGHIHNTTVTHIDRRYNVSVDVINYT